MFDFLKRKSAKDTPSPVVEMMNLTIGRSVEVDRMAYRFWPDDGLMELETSAFLIVAQGFVDLGEGSFLHRFYPSDDSALLQIQGGDGRNSTQVDEIVLWTYLDEEFPATDADWQRHLQQIKSPIYRAGEDATEFQRVWFGPDAPSADPITYWETVYDTKDGQESRRIFQTAMLYGRELSDGSDEMLLVNLEETESRDRLVSRMIGRALTPQNLIL